jgi:hypothetical protein
MGEEIRRRRCPSRHHHRQNAGPATAALLVGFGVEMEAQPYKIRSHPPPASRRAVAFCCRSFNRQVCLYDIGQRYV